MNLYLITQNINSGYDTYDAVVVAAESEEDARTISPNNGVTHCTKNSWMGTFSGGHNIGKEYEIDSYDWVEFDEINKIKVELIGTTDRKKGVVLASYNAG